MLAEANQGGGLEKTLGVWDLIILGVGAIIGSGIFAVVGIAAAGAADGSSIGAGPALIISMIIAAIAYYFEVSFNIWVPTLVYSLLDTIMQKYNDFYKRNS